MALITCKECKRSISDEAETCPNCGKKQKAAYKTKPFTKWIAIFSLCYLVYYIASFENTTTHTKAITPEQQRTALIKQEFSSWNGAHRNLEKLMKSNLKDPDSYEHIETTYVDKNNYILVRMKYRAKNGFGGYAVGEVVAKCSVQGDVLEIISST